MNKTALTFLAFLLLITGCSSSSDSGQENVYAVIPAPQFINEMQGEFVFSPGSKIIVPSLDDDTRLAADFLSKLVANPTGKAPGEEGITGIGVYDDRFGDKE
jgi:hypothetical protein